MADEGKSGGDNSNCRIGSMELDQETCDFYCRSMQVLIDSGVPFLVGGAYAFERYTGIGRHTKDFDVFVRKADSRAALKAFEEAGYNTELSFPHWLGKAYGEDDLFIDVIFSSGNGVADVDDIWFEHAVEDEVLGIPVKLCPPEEIIWTKALIQERERFDGADVAHLLKACARGLNWEHLLRRFGDMWRVLFGHLVLFGFIYPGERDSIPESVMRELMSRLDRELSTPLPQEKVCQGTVISRQQYLVDTDEWGYEDGRLEPRGNMSQMDIDHWTTSIEVDGKGH